MDICEFVYAEVGRWHFPPCVLCCPVMYDEQLFKKLHSLEEAYVSLQRFLGKKNPELWIRFLLFLLEFIGASGLFAIVVVSYLLNIFSCSAKICGAAAVGLWSCPRLCFSS